MRAARLSVLAALASLSVLTMPSGAAPTPGAITRSTTTPAIVTDPAVRARREITFARFDPALGDFSLWSARRDGSHELRLSDEPSFFSDWSPDGRSIVYDFFAGHQEHLGVVSPDGRRRRQLSRGPGIQEAPEWSPDGRWITFTTEPGGPESILRVRPDGSGLGIFRPATSGYQFYKAVWAHDGRSLLVGCNDLHTHIDKLCTMDARGHHVRLLVDSTPLDVNYPGR